MITPYRSPTTSAEKKYNKALSGTRASIERCFGMWKRRFPIIGSKTQIKVQNLLTIIVATGVLHNLAIDLNDIFYDDEEIDLNILNEDIGQEGVENDRYTTVRTLITRAFT